MYLQRLEDVTFLDAVVDCTETSLSTLGEVRQILSCLQCHSLHTSYTLSRQVLE